MIWVDRIVADIQERFAQERARGETLVIRDEKTLSGRVHVGSLRGIAIHGLLSQVLTERDIPNVFRFELNDFDPMDEIPATFSEELRTQYRSHMGKPLFTVPDLEGKATNYPMIFGEELREVVSRLGFPVEWYPLAPDYREGKFNGVIREALDAAVEIRAIYREVSGSKKPDDWYPLQVICERCGKVSTTIVTGWDPRSEHVQYTCKPDLVTWAQGCGHRGNVNPFNGRAKLPWKVEWPAKWKVFGVHIEGAGKDHGAAGGSRDIGRRIVTEIFHYREPFNIPYEFFNLGGKKMSASKGIGASAKEMGDLLPPTILRLLLIRKMPNQPIDFDPEGTTIPHLFDEYDRLADHVFKRHPSPDPDFARTYTLCQRDFLNSPLNLWHMRFTTVAFLVQMPHLNLWEEAAKLKGSALTKEEFHDLTERAEYVKKWLRDAAPPKYTFVLASGMFPSNAAGRFSAEEKVAIAAVHAKLAALSNVSWNGPMIHEAIHAVKQERSITPATIFRPLYQIFLNRDDGPQIGWFLSTLERDHVLRQIQYYA